jgi:hypothetical protein
MLEELKEITVGSMLTIDNTDVLELTDTEDFTVVSVKAYSQDEGDIAMINMENYYLIAHTLNGEPRYYVAERISSGRAEDLEDDGFRMVIKDDSMPNKLYYGRKDREIAYRAKNGPVYSMNIERHDGTSEDEPSDVAVCEYRGKTKVKLLSFILLERLDDRYAVYQGLQISESNILL